MDCRSCEPPALFLYDKIGHHLRNQHRATHISCPGLKCGKSREIFPFKFKDHLEKCHMSVTCVTCAAPLLISNVSEHMRLEHGKIEKFQKKSDPDVQKRKVTYETLLNGQLLIVDSIHFFVRSKVAFVDCPICQDKSLALHLLDEHIINHHCLS